jgi:hypothetical protein
MVDFSNRDAGEGFSKPREAESKSGGRKIQMLGEAKSKDSASANQVFSGG